MPMAIGAAIGAAVTGSGRKTFCLAGDGGFILNLGELACMVQEKAPMVIVLMNDKSYGVIKNIQDAQYGGRQCYAELHTPDYDLLCKSIALPHARVQKLDELPARLDQALATQGPFLLEIDMLSIGGFKSTFAGPPTNTITQIPALGTAK
jgi:acetolactate synthase-1/2/3 large subunit